MSIPSISLNDGRSIPQLGLGTWPLKGEDATAVVTTAIEVGYRHIDTAARYDNEAAVGEGIRRSGIDRDELFVTTKLDGEFQGGDRALAGLALSLERLGLDRVDLLLIHWPLPARGEFVSTWRTFERLRDEGLASSIGVSNFLPAHLEALAAETATVPAVNQIQLSPAIPRLQQRAYNLTHGIVTESWSPIKGILDRPEVLTVAERYERTPAQVVLRWHLQNGLVAIPKSSDRVRLTQNLDIIDFELDAAAIGALDSVDAGPDVGVNSETDGH